MARRLVMVATLLALLMAGTVNTARAAAPGASFLALCYHDVQDVDPDQTFVGVTTARLVEQLDWLQQNGYRFVSVDDLLAARDGSRPLPNKAVLLTFDDGLESFYTRAFPILQAFQAPAVLALVGEWLTGAPGTTVAYGEARVPRDTFLSWDQVRAIARSGLVEIASHSFDLHHGIAGNPQGNTEPAAVTRRRDPGTGAYESEAAYDTRLGADADAETRLFVRELGRAPRVLVWPYGEHSEAALSIEAAHGTAISFTLADGIATVDRLGAAPRHLITPDPVMDQYVSELRELGQHGPQRAVQIDLDDVYDPDPAQQARNLDRLVQRVQDMEITTVFLQAFADPGGDGLAREVYFPNHELPMRADLFNRVAWQLRTRARVKVFAWMPVLAFDLDPAIARVEAWSAGGDPPRAAPQTYRRISPFDPDGRRTILALYADLARAASFEGLLFHDDATLSDFEDASAPALAAYARAGLPASIAALRADPALMQRWTRFKTDALIEFTEELAQAARHYRTPLRTARNLYARPLLDPASEAWFAQQPDRFLEAYDETVVMAMPWLEDVPRDDADAWLRRLVAAVAAHPHGLERTLFELQAVDWRAPPDSPARHVSAAVLGGQMRLLARLGAVNFGYYPDDFLDDRPAQARLHRDFSLQSYAYRP